MPEPNKRINLSIPNELYEQISAYKEKICLPSDAAACVQLIRLQLRSIEQSEKMMEVIRTLSPQQLDEITKEGFQFIKDADK